MNNYIAWYPYYDPMSYVFVVFSITIFFNLFLLFLLPNCQELKRACEDPNYWKKTESLISHVFYDLFIKLIYIFKQKKST